MRTSKRQAAAARARYGIIANKLFFDYCYDGDYAAFRARLDKYKGVVRRQLKHIIVTDRCDDIRPGSETYGYKDLESIECNLQYISDRFNACFRLRWLLDLADQPIK